MYDTFLTCQIFVNIVFNKIVLMDEGYVLKKWVKSKGYKAAQVADMLGLTSRQAIYEVYKRETLSHDHKEALKKKGFDVENVKYLSEESQDSGEEKAYAQIVIALENKIEDLKKELYSLSGEVKIIKEWIKPIKSKS